MLKFILPKKPPSQIFEMFYTHMVAAHMLFPKSEQNRLGYICLSLNNIISKMLADNVLPEILFPVILKFLHNLFKNDAFYQQFSEVYPPNVTEWEIFQDLVINTRFSASGKGSIEEAIIRGRIAGYILLDAMHMKTSLKQAAIYFEDNQKSFDHVHKGAFTITQINIINNIWPEFKQSAHLWAATFDFDEIKLIRKRMCQVALLDLYDISKLSIPWDFIKHVRENNAKLEDFECCPPSKHLSWRALLDKANSVLDLCEKRVDAKGNPKPILKRDECWVFPVEIQ